MEVKGLYMFRALLTHPQEALNKRHFVNYIYVISAAPELQYTRSAVPPSPGISVIYSPRSALGPITASYKHGMPTEGLK
jgi:hypothetical protein